MKMFVNVINNVGDGMRTCRIDLSKLATMVLGVSGASADSAVSASVFPSSRVLGTTSALNLVTGNGLPSSDVNLSTKQSQIAIK